MIYNPDKWKVLRITNKQTNVVHYRIFATWGGSYSYGSSWKLSSGIESVKQDGHYWILPQTSGSTYQIHMDTEGVVGGWFGIIEQLIKDSSDVQIDILESPDFLLLFNTV